MSDETSSPVTSDAEQPVRVRLADGNEATVDPRGGPTCMQVRSLPGPWQYHVDVASIGGVLGIVHLCVKQQNFIPSGLETPITSKGLRTVPLRRFLQGAREALQRQQGEFATHPVETTPPPGSRRWPAEHYLEVAREYWRAEATGQPPRQAIATRWNVAKVTASRWLHRARELGYVDPYEPHRPRRLEPDPPADYADFTRQLEAQIFRRILTDLATTAASPVREKAQELADAIHNSHIRDEPGRTLSIREWVMQGART
jgi:hypothetical protein